MSKLNIKPLADRVLVEPAAAETKTSSGIIIPDAVLVSASIGSNRTLSASGLIFNFITTLIWLIFFTNHAIQNNLTKLHEGLIIEY